MIKKTNAIAEAEREVCQVIRLVESGEYEFVGSTGKTEYAVYDVSTREMYMTVTSRAAQMIIAWEAIQGFRNITESGYKFLALYELAGGLPARREQDE